MGSQCCSSLSSSSICICICILLLYYTNKTFWPLWWSSLSSPSIWHPSLCPHTKVWNRLLWRSLVSSSQSSALQEAPGVQVYIALYDSIVWIESRVVAQKNLGGEHDHQSSFDQGVTLSMNIFPCRWSTSCCRILASHPLLFQLTSSPSWCGMILINLQLVLVILHTSFLPFTWTACALATGPLNPCMLQQLSRIVTWGEQHCPWLVGSLFLQPVYYPQVW